VIGASVIFSVSGIPQVLRDQELATCLCAAFIHKIALADQINAAASAASAGQTKAESNILQAFRNLVNAQTSKHINGIAPQVLLADAESLISQI
jgi:hypothetical protein